MVTFRNVPEKKEPDAAKLATDNILLTKKNTTLEIQITELNAAIEAKDAQIAEKEALIKEYEASNSSLTQAKEEVSTAKQQLAQLQEEKASLLSRLEEAQTELKDVKAQLEIVREELEKEKEARAKEVANLKSEIEDLEKKSKENEDRFTVTLAEKVEELERANTNITELDEEIKSLKATAENLNRIIESMETSGNSDAAEIEGLKRALSVSEKARAELVESREAIVAKINVLSGGVKSYLQAVEEFDKLTETSKKAEGEVEEVLKALMEKEEELKVSSQELQKAQRKLANATKRNTASVKLVQEMESDYADLLEKLQKVEAENEDLKYGIAVIGGKLADAETKILDLTDQIEEYKAQIDANEEINDEKMAKLQAQLQAQRDNLVNIKKELAIKSAELGRVKGNLTNSVNARKKRDEEIATLKSQIKLLEKNIAASEKSFSSLVEENERLKQENEDLLVGIAEAESKRIEAEEARDKTQFEKMAVEAEKQELQGLLDSVNADLESFKTSYTELENQNSAIVARISEIYTAKIKDGKATTTEKQIEEIELKLIGNEEFEELKNQYKELQNSNSKITEQIDELFEQIDELYTDYVTDGKANTVEEMIDAIRTQIEKLEQDLAENKESSLKITVENTKSIKRLREKTEVLDADLQAISQALSSQLQKAKKVESEMEDVVEAYLIAEEEAKKAQEAQVEAEAKAERAVESAKKNKGLLKVAKGLGIALGVVAVVGLSGWSITDIAKNKTIKKHAGTIVEMEVDSLKTSMEAKHEKYSSYLETVNEKRIAVIALKEQHALLFENNEILSTNFANMEGVVQTINDSNIRQKFENAYNNYNVAVENDNQTDMISNEEIINQCIDNMSAYASQATAYHEAINSELNKNLEAYQVIKFEDIEPTSEAYSQFKTLFAGAMVGTGSIEIVDFVYQGANGVVNITYNKIDGYGNVIQTSCNKSYKIESGLANSNEVLGVLNELLNGNTTNAEEEIQP